MTTIDVFVKGNAHTPSRFWDYALRTETKRSSFYDELGFKYSKKYTDEYKALNEIDRAKIKFKFINGILQEY